MSYRTYIASHSKQTSEEKYAIGKNIIIPAMLADEDTQDFFLNHEFLRRFGCKIQIELGQDDTITAIHKKCPAYLPDNLCKLYPDYLPQSCKDTGYIGLLTKDLLWEYIHALHDEQIRQYEQDYDACKKDAAYAKNYALMTIGSQQVTWKTSKDFLQEDQLPYAITHSTEYFIYQLVTLYQNTDFQKTDLIVYGW